VDSVWKRVSRASRTCAHARTTHQRLADKHAGTQDVLHAARNEQPIARIYGQGGELPRDRDVPHRGRRCPDVAEMSRLARIGPVAIERAGG